MGMGDLAPTAIDPRLRLAVGGEEFYVDAGPDTDFQPLPDHAPCLRPRSDGSLVLAPPRRLYHVALGAAIVAAAGYFVLEWALPGRGGWALLLAVAALVKGYLDRLHTLYRQSVRFDRGAGRVTLGGWQGGHPLASVAAVLFVPLAGNRPGGQLHLVLTDLSLPRTSARALPRRRIAQFGEVDELRRIGRRLADFLGVPFLEPSATATPAPAVERSVAPDRRPAS
jgi:hypothetical protein